MGLKCVLLELACHLAMTALEVKLDLLEQAASIASAMARRVKLVHQSRDRGFACEVAGEGHEVRIHDLLRLGDGARTIRGCEADDEVHGFSEMIHSTGFTDRR